MVDNRVVELIEMVLDQPILLTIYGTQSVLANMLPQQIIFCLKARNLIFQIPNDP
jgi:hypothetical protein